MPSADSQTPKGTRLGLLVAALVFIGLGAFLIYKFSEQQPAKPQTVAVAKTETPAPASKPTTTATVPTTSPPAAPGTVVSVEEVLSRVDKWMTEHPTYHLKAVTAFPNGVITGKMDMYTYSNAADGKITSIRADLYNPNDIQFVSVKHDGVLKTYFPGTDQMVEQDLAKSLASMPMLANTTGYKGLMKLSKNSFAEASADLMVATLVLNTVALKMGDLPSEDIYLSIRCNNEGKLLGIGEQVGAGRSLTSIEYVTFDAAAVTREAPTLPAGKLTQTNKNFQQVMLDEIRLVSKKPFGKKI